VVLGDVFGGGFGLQANLLGAMMDARRRFLKPGGTLLPRGAVLYCMPVELPGFYQEVMEPWTADLNGFDHRPCRTRLANQTHRCVLPPESALAPPFRLGEVRLEEIETASWRGEAEFEMAREGSLHGVGAWCDVRLDQDITASNSPFASRRLAWHHVLFPLETPVEVRAGWRVKACFHLAAEGPWMVWNWRIAVASEHGPAAEFQHSTFRGDLLPPTTFRRSWPASVPVPSDRAEIVRAVLELCDGRRSVAEMRKEIARRFPTAFPNAGQALRLIRSVIDLTCQ
jgi:protein arginine N-methyltransferase 1